MKAIVDGAHRADLKVASHAMNDNSTRVSAEACLAEIAEHHFATALIGIAIRRYSNSSLPRARCDAGDNSKRADQIASAQTESPRVGCEVRNLVRQADPCQTKKDVVVRQPKARIRNDVAAYRRDVAT